MKIALAVSAAALFVAPAAMGDVTIVSRGPGLGLAVGDNAYDGSLGSMTVDRLTIGERGIIKDVNVKIGMSHTWVGDLTIKLLGPGGQLVTLVSRAGFAEPADDGGGCCGFSSDLTFANRIGYDDEQTILSENFAGNPVTGNYKPSHGAAAPSALSDFDGSDMFGLWTLYIGDGAAGDLGVLDYWELEITYNIPAPGALALLGLAGLTSRRRRRA